jgi:hypothetical protein
LKILERCAHVSGTVMAYRKEHDGDYHVSMVMDQPGWTNSFNNERQHGYTVVEFVPLMPKPDRFKVGQRLKLTGTKVLDLQHGDHKDDRLGRDAPGLPLRGADRSEDGSPERAEAGAGDGERDAMRYRGERRPSDHVTADILAATSTAGRVAFPLSVCAIGVCSPGAPRATATGMSREVGGREPGRTIARPSHVEPEPGYGDGITLVLRAVAEF